MNNLDLQYQKLLRDILDNRATKSGDWLMISINKFQHTKFKLKKQYMLILSKNYLEKVG